MIAIVRSCPLCASTNIKVTHNFKIDPHGLFKIQCSFCGLSIEGINAQLIESRWNTRHHYSKNDFVEVEEII